MIKVYELIVEAAFVIPDPKRSPLLKDEKSREYDSDSTLSQYGSEDRSLNLEYLNNLDRAETSNEFSNRLDSYLQISESSDDDEISNKENVSIDSSMFVPESPDLSICHDSPSKAGLSRDWSESPIQKINSINSADAESVYFIYSCFW